MQNRVETISTLRDGIPIAPVDLVNLDRWSREPGHDDTLAGYVPKLLDEIDRLKAEILELQDDAGNL